ncbi:MAG: polymorphic toxin-type HINT domain-containing protein [Bacteroidota bacterium]
MGLKKILLSLLCSVLLVGWTSAQDTTDTSQGSYFLSFVKKVYFNPTILLATQDFREQHNVRVLVLPDLNGAEENQITGFERGMQKIIRFLIEGDDEGSFRFYFDAEDTESPFSFVCAEELHCKFTSADKDSIEHLLNAPFNNAEYDLNSHALFEASIEGALDYAGKCLLHVTAECGPMPEHATIEINTKPLSISVHATQNTLYDLDHKQFDLLESHYAKAHDVFTDQDWYAPAKLMVSGESDEPVAIAIDKHETLFKKQNLVFRTVYNNQVIPIEQSSTNDTIKLKLPADLPSGNPVEVVVKYTSTVDSLQYTVGFFMVYVYEPKTVKVNLLAANGYTIDEAAILSELKAVYDPVGITFELDKKEWMPDSEWPVQIDIESSGLLSNYPADLRDWVDGVQELNDYDEDEYYLVFGLGTPELDGYMPRARNIGFVFSGENTAGNTAAHELGHGVFHLRHIFAEEELGLEAYKATGNVMDYVPGQGELYLHQWKYIDDPASVSWNDGDDEDAGLSVGKSSGVPDVLLNSDTTSVSFVTPGGEIISFNKKGVKGYYCKFYSDAVEEIAVPIGVLTSFLYYGKRYDAVIEYLPNNLYEYIFKGYKNISGEVYVDNYRDSLDVEAKKTACMLVYEPLELEYWRFEKTGISYGNSYAGGSTKQVHGGWEFPFKPYDNLTSSVGHTYSFTRINNLNDQERIRYNHLREVVAYHSFKGDYQKYYAAHAQVLDLASFEPEILYLFSEKEKIFQWGEEGMWESGAEWLVEVDLGVNLNSGFDEFMEANTAVPNVGNARDLFMNNTPVFYEKIFIPRYRNFKTQLEENIGQFWDGFSEAYYIGLDSDQKKESYINLLRIALNLTPINTLLAQSVYKKTAAVKILTSTDNYFTTPWEDALVKLLRGVKKEDANLFLTTLETQKNFSLDGNDRINLTEFIVDHVHNVGFGEQYTEVAIQLGRIANSDVIRLEALATNIMGNVAQLDKYIIPYYHTNFWSEVKNAFNPWADPAFETDSEIAVVGDTARVKFTSYKYDIGGNAYWPILSPLGTCLQVVNTPKSLKAFDIVIIESKTEDINFTDFSPATGGKVNGVFPVFILNYMDDEATAKKIQDGIEAAVDVLSIAVGVGPAMAGLRTFRGFVALMDVAGSTLSLANNASGQQYQPLNVVTNIFAVANISLSVTDMYNAIKMRSSVNAMVTGPNPIKVPTAAEMKTLAGKFMLDELGESVSVSGKLTVLKQLMNSGDIENKLKTFLVLRRYEIDLKLAKKLGSEEYQTLLLLKKEVGGDWKNILKLGTSASLDWSNIAAKYKKTAEQLAVLGVIDGMDIKIGNQIIGTFQDNILNIPLIAEGASYTKVEKFFPDMSFKSAGIAYENKPMMLVKRMIGQNEVYACLVAGACFTAETPVSTTKGYVPIAAVHEGDSVLSYNEDTQELVYQSVTSTFRKTVDKLVRVIIGKDTIFATPEHLFMNEKKEWITAGALRRGMRLFMAGGFGMVMQTHAMDSNVVVYNLEVDQTHTYTVGYGKMVVHNDCSWYATIQNISAASIDKLKALKTTNKQFHDLIKAQLGANGADIEKFLEHFADNATARSKFVAGTILVEDWNLLRVAHPNLAKETASLEAFSKARKNTRLQELGFTGASLARVSGYANVSFADLMTDLDNFAKNMVQNNVTIENFQATIGILSGNNQNYRQGVHWVIRDLRDNASFFNGKTVSLEVAIANARGTSSSIDAFCANCVPPNLKIEYKSGPGSIKTGTIKEQFIERDLFNAAALSEIQWRMTGTDFTPDKLKTWLKENKATLDEMINSTDVNVSTKFRNWFGVNSMSMSVADTEIDTFVDLNYNAIFK